MPRKKTNPECVDNKDKPFRKRVFVEKTNSLSGSSIVATIVADDCDPLLSDIPIADSVDTDIVSNEKKKTSKTNIGVVLPAICKHRSKSCLTAISSNRRQFIYEKFRSLSRSCKQAFIISHCEKYQVARSTVGFEVSRRKNSIRYFLPNDARIRTEVCKPFFLTTIGNDPKNDRIIHYTLKTKLDTVYCDGLQDLTRLPQKSNERIRFRKIIIQRQVIDVRR